MMNDLKAAREEEDVIMAMALLQPCLHKNVGGIFSSELYSYLHTGEPKQITKDFVREVVTTLKWTTTAAGPQEQKLMKELLARAVFSYGRFALCLSGGANMVSTIWFHNIIIMDTVHYNLSHAAFFSGLVSFRNCASIQEREYLAKDSGWIIDGKCHCCLYLY